MKVYEVGGCVRDELMGVKPMDRDWVVVNSSPAEMEHKGFKPIGKDFPVFLHPVTKEEYALARTEKKSGTGYKDFTFYFDKNVTLEEDLQRRDLTINAMAKDSNGEIIDPFGGMKDIQQQIFRHTSPAFAEDPLRALRLARLKSYPHLSKFSTAIETTKLIQDIVMSDELSALSADRVWMEVSKALANKDSKNFFKHGLWSKSECRKARFRNSSRARRRLSINSGLNLPTSNFSGTGGIIMPGYSRDRMACKRKKSL